MVLRTNRENKNKFRKKTKKKKKKQNETRKRRVCIVEATRRAAETGSSGCSATPIKTGYAQRSSSGQTGHWTVLRSVGAEHHPRSQVPASG